VSAVSPFTKNRHFPKQFSLMRLSASFPGKKKQAGRYSLFKMTAQMYVFPQNLKTSPQIRLFAFFIQGVQNVYCICFKGDEDLHGTTGNDL
jgi:hypothetical protein